MRIRIAGMFWLMTVAGCAQMMSSRTQNGITTVTLSPKREEFTRPVTGAPYSADSTMEHTQTLADGTHLSGNPMTQHLFRDSQGRTREERPFMMAAPGMQGDQWPLMVEIRDPIAGYHYILDDIGKIAHRFAMPSAPPARTASPNAGEGRLNQPDEAHKPQFNREKLGSETIEGVVAEGTRMTTTWPIGAQGNDRPLVNITESWFSPELKVMVLLKFISPRNGETVTKLTNISRAEPDPALFQPPAGYTMVDDKESFTITLKR